MKKLFAFILIIVLCGCSKNENTFSTISSYILQHEEIYKETYLPHHYFNDQYPKTTLTEEDNVTIYCVNENNHVYHMIFTLDNMTIAYWFNHSDDVDYKLFIERLKDVEDFRYYYIKEYNYVSVMYKDENLDMCIDFSEYDESYSQDELIDIGMDILYDTILLNQS